MWGGNSHPNIKTLIPYLFVVSFCRLCASSPQPFTAPGRVRKSDSASNPSPRKEPRHPAQLSFTLCARAVFVISFFPSFSSSLSFWRPSSSRRPLPQVSRPSRPSRQPSPYQRFLRPSQSSDSLFLWVFPTFRASLSVCVRGSCRRCPARPRRSTPAKWLRAARTEDPMP